MHMNRRTRKGLLESHLGLRLLLVVPHASNPTSPLTPRRCALRDRHCLRRQPSRPIQCVCPSFLGLTPPNLAAPSGLPHPWPAVFCWPEAINPPSPSSLHAADRVPPRCLPSQTLRGPVTEQPASEPCAESQLYPFRTLSDRYTKPRWPWQQREFAGQ